MQTEIVAITFMGENVQEIIAGTIIRVPNQDWSISSFQIYIAALVEIKMTGEALIPTGGSECINTK